MRRAQGFTLIELAIVLVIIGIIIGMVLKGQDLIQNARIKSFVNKTRHWETYMWIYYDRKGKFPGDDDKNGLIADEVNSSSTVCNDIVNANFSNPPYEGIYNTDFNCTTNNPGGNTITQGSNTFHVFFGSEGGNNKNIMVICVASDCNTTFSQEQVAFAEALDASLDGVADGTTGNVICTNTAPNSVSNASWEATYTNAPSADGCTTSARAIVYYFDAKR